MEQIWNLCKYLRFEPKVVDIVPDCLARIYAKLIFPDGKVPKARNNNEPSPGDIAVMNIHQGRIEFLLLENGLFFLYSGISIDMKQIQERYQKTPNLANLSSESGAVETEEVTIPKDEGLKDLNDEDTEILYERNETIQAIQERALRIQPSLTQEKDPVNRLLPSHDSTQESMINSLQAKVIDDDSHRFWGTTPTEVNSQKPTEVEHPIHQQVQSQLVLPDLELRETQETPQNNWLDQEDPQLRATIVEEERLSNTIDSLEELYLMDTQSSLSISDFHSERRSPKDQLEIDLNPVLTAFSEILLFFAARHYGQSITSIYLTGEYARIPYLEEVLHENYGLPTQLGFPHQWKPKLAGRLKK